MTKYLLLLLCLAPFSYAQDDLEDSLALDPFKEELNFSSDVYTPKEQEKLDEKAEAELYTEPDLSTGTPVLTAEDDTPTKETPAEEELYEKPSPELTTPVVTTLEADQPRGGKEFNPRKSRLVTTFGFEGLKYDFEQSFKGEKKELKDESREFYGARLGTGYEIYLGAGFNTTSKVDVFYVGTTFNQKKSAAPDLDVEFAYTKKTGSLWGAEVAQSIGYLFDMKSKNLFGDMIQLTIEPFIEAGIGRAYGYNKVAYNYETSVVEKYERTVQDDLLSTRLSIGFNVISSQGYFLHLMASQTTYNLTDRKITEKSKQNGQPESPTVVTFDDDASFDPIFSFVLGGGYKF